MNRRILTLLIGFIMTLGVFFRADRAFACDCHDKRIIYPFTCGLGLPCEYQQFTTVCSLGGCMQCKPACGSGECTCGNQQYTSDCLVTCGSELVNKDTRVMYARVAAPDCHGVYRTSDPPLISARRIQPTNTMPTR